MTITMTITMTVINKKDNDNDKGQSWRLEIIETLFAFLTIEKNNLNIKSEPSIKSDRGQHSQFSQCFLSLFHF